MPEDSEIVILARKQKRLLEAQDAAVMRSMARQWLAVERALEAEMLKTVTTLGGEKLVTEAMILRNTHFQKLLYQARAEYGKFADYLERSTTNLQGDLLAQGIDDAVELLTKSMAGAGINLAFDKLPFSALEAMMGFSADGSPLRNLLMKSYGEAVNGIMQELLIGLAKGLNPVKVAKSMAEGFSIGLERALTIARTEMGRAYRMGSLGQYRSSGVVPQYKRLATKDSRTCPGCLFADGEIFDTAEEFDEHPNGRCVIVPVVNGVSAPQWETGTAWFEKQDEATQRSILGDGRFEAWKNGTPLSSMSKRVTNETWGGAFVPTPVKDL